MKPGTIKSLGTKLVIVCLIWMLAVPAWLVETVKGAENSIQQIGNGYVDVYVDPSTGRFVIASDEGNPRRDQDDEKSLLFGGDQPKTSFTTFRINGQDYIYGNEYGFLSKEGVFSQLPQSHGMSNQSTWNVDGLEITQTLTLVSDPSNPDVGNVKISYQVKNTSDMDKEVGSRILLDTQLGLKDASPITYEGYSSFIQTETEWVDDIPQYWRAVDETIAPNMMSYGFLKGWDNEEPDRVIIGHWAGLSSNKWEYTPDETVNFTSAKNKYGTADSALAIYWEEETLAPDEERVYETFYGLGKLFSSDQAVSYDLLLSAPRQLTVNDDKDGYEEETFDIYLQLDNTLSGAQALDNVEVSLVLPAELQLAASEQAVKTFTSVAVNETKNVGWKVEATPQSSYKAVRYGVRVKADGVEEAVKANVLILPAVNGAPPDVQVHDLLPDIKYTGDETHEFIVLGEGFAVLQDNPNVEVELIREHDGMTYTLSSGQFQVNGNQIRILLDELWDSTEKKQAEAGLYTLRINTQKYGSFTKQLEYTDDTAYQSLQYGILAVVSGKDHSHDLVALENEEQLQELTDEVLLVLRGKVKELKDGEHVRYEVSKGATINSVVRFEEDASVADWLGMDQIISVYKEDNQVELQGTGVLSIPSFPFVFGSFQVVLKDGTDYELSHERNESQKAVNIEWPLVTWSGQANINALPVQIMGATLGQSDGKDTVSFQGKVSLSFNGKKDENEAETSDDDKGEDAGTGSDSGTGSGSKGDGTTEGTDETANESSDKVKIAAELFEARFGMSDGQFGLLGLHAGGGVSLPDNFIPGMNFGADAVLNFNTFTQTYGLDVNVSFEIIEVDGSIVLRLTDNNIPIVDKLVVTVGSEPGIPLVPPSVVGYITEAGGGFDHLYDTIMGNYEALPPLKLILNGEMDLAKLVKATDVTFEASLRGASFSGAFEIASVPILDSVYGSVNVADSKTHLAVDLNIGAQLNVLEFLKGQIEATFSYDETRTGILGPVYLAGRGSLTALIPSSVPVIGGMSLAEVAAEISTEQLYASASIAKVPISITYEWGGEVKFAGNPVTVSSARASASNGIMEQAVYDPETGAYMGMLKYGTNMRKLSPPTSARIEGSSNDNVVRIASDSYTAKANVMTKEDYVVFELIYKGEVVPNVTVHDPSHQPLPIAWLEDGEGNARLQTIPADESESGLTETHLYIFVESPQEGEWTFTSDVSMEGLPQIYAVSDLPKLQHVQATKSGDTIHVTWETLHIDPDMEVALYLVEERTASDTDDPDQSVYEKLVLGPDGIPASDHGASFTLPASLPSGNYDIRAVLVDGDVNLHSVVSDDSIQVNNAQEPDMPGDAQAVNIGNGLLQVDWSYDSSKAVDGFVLQVKDRYGSPVTDLGVIMIDDATARSANIGGSFTHLETGEQVGLLPGNAYSVSVSGYKVVDGVKIIGTPITTEPVTIRQPNPPQVDITVPSDQAKRILDESGREWYITNKQVVDLTVTSDQFVDASLYVDGVKMGDFEGASGKHTLSLKDGEHLIEVYAVNVRGDLQTRAMTVHVDTVAPELKMSASDGLYATDGKVNVSGITEPGSSVMIAGQPAVVADDGRFSTDISMTGYAARTIQIEAEDLAGNRTTYQMEAVNPSIPAFEKVEIRLSRIENEVTIASTVDTDVLEEDGETDVIAIQQGQSEKLMLVGIDAAGTEYQIDDDNVEWEFLLGDERASLTSEGILEANYEGEVVVKASYALSTDYAMEDAIIVNVEEIDSAAPTDPTDKSGSSTNIYEQLERILKYLIELEEDVDYLGYAALSDEEDMLIQLDASTALTFFKQDGISGIGVGYGKVKEPQHYLYGALAIVQ